MVPRLNALDLEDAHRAVPEDGACAGDLGAVRRDRRGPMSTPFWPSGMSTPTSRAGAPPPTSAGDQMVDGQPERGRAAAAGACEHVAGDVERSSSTSESPTAWPLRLQERVGHGAADQERVDLVDQVLDHLDLVGDLGAAEDGDERPRRDRG